MLGTNTCRVGGPEGPLPLQHPQPLPLPAHPNSLSQVGPPGPQGTSRLPVTPTGTGTEPTVPKVCPAGCPCQPSAPRVPDPAGSRPAPCTPRARPEPRHAALPAAKTPAGGFSRSRAEPDTPREQNRTSTFPLLPKQRQEAPSRQSRAAAGAARARSVLGQNEVEEPPLRKRRAQGGSSRGALTRWNPRARQEGAEHAQPSIPGQTGCDKQHTTATLAIPTGGCEPPGAPRAPARYLQGRPSSGIRSRSPEPAPDLFYLGSDGAGDGALPREGRARERCPQPPQPSPAPRAGQTLPISPAFTSQSSSIPQSTRSKRE